MAVVVQRYVLEKHRIAYLFIIVFILGGFSLSDDINHQQ